MGENRFTRDLYATARAKYDIGDVGTKHTTKAAEQKARSTGKLETLVDPSSFGVVRLSLPRVEKLDNGQYELLVGAPMPVETRVDTTGSMGGNVDVALDILPDAFESWTRVLPGYDLQIATGIFGDVSDNFPLCRPQFEMVADKIVGQLSMMVPERDGGDMPEDPDLGIFGGAYLVRAYINRIGLKRYDFTVTDAPGRGMVSGDQLKRVYGEEVFDKVVENGHRDLMPLNEKDGHFSLLGTIELKDIWDDLLQQAHAFVLLVTDRAGNVSSQAAKFWEGIAGKSRVIVLPDMKLLPQVQAVIIGLTEGTLKLTKVPEFLREFNLDDDIIEKILGAVINVPHSVQSRLQQYSTLPQKGDIFEGKPDVWNDKHLHPVKKTEHEPVAVSDEEDDWK